VGKGERETGGTFLVDRQLAARGSEVVFGILVEDAEDHLIRSDSLRKVWTSKRLCIDPDF
jgi:hypothetical protein